jgi:UDP-glucose 4-epimerase
MAFYVVTGGAGFIGSHLCEALLKQGHRVRVVDNFITGRHENLPQGVELWEEDIRYFEKLTEAFAGADGVFHVAALPRVPYSIEYPIETSANNIMGTLNVLVAARDAKVKRVVYSASSSAYGVQAKMPLTPDMAPNPMNPYAVQKYVGEIFAKQFSMLYGLETVSLRYFNVYGPRMATEGAYVLVMSILMRQKLAGEKLTIQGDGEQSRDFTHVFDVVRANLLAMGSSKVGKGEVLNVGAGETHSINEIARMIGGETMHLPPRPGDPRMTQADFSLTKQLIDWEPSIKFTEGFREVLKNAGIEPQA